MSLTSYRAAPPRDSNFKISFFQVFASGKLISGEVLILVNGIMDGRSELIKFCGCWDRVKWWMLAR